MSGDNPPRHLDLRLLARQDGDGAGADDVADLQLEFRVARDLECLDPAVFQAAALQDAERRRDRGPVFFTGRRL